MPMTIHTSKCIVRNGAQKSEYATIWLCSLFNTSRLWQKSLMHCGFIQRSHASNKVFLTVAHCVRNREYYLKSEHEYEFKTLLNGVRTGVYQAALRAQHVNNPPTEVGWNSLYRPGYVASSTAERWFRIANPLFSTLILKKMAAARRL